MTISYNQAAFIERAIQSIISQKSEDVDLEYIVVDAGSTDGSREIIESYRDEIDHIIFESDKGASDGLNKGFSYATGGLLGFINSDDYLLEGAILKITDAFNKYPDVDVVQGHGIKVDRDGQLMQILKSTLFSVNRFLFGATTLVQQSTFFKSTYFKKVGGFNLENNTCWDGELFLDMAANGAKFSILNESLAAFCIHEDSISGSNRLEKLYKEDLNRLFKKYKYRERSFLDKYLISTLYLVEKKLFL